MLMPQKNSLLSNLAQEQSKMEDIEVWVKAGYLPPVIFSKNANIRFEYCIPDLILAVKENQAVKEKYQFVLEVEDDGSLSYVERRANDRRITLFPVDLKMGKSVLPNIPEAAYYGYTLALFLKENGYDSQYAVCESGILPDGGREILPKITNNKIQFFKLIQQHVNWASLDVWTGKLNNFFRGIIPENSQLTWETAERNIDKNKCIACPYLGLMDEVEPSCYSESKSKERLEAIATLGDSFVKELEDKSIFSISDFISANPKLLWKKDEWGYKEYVSLGGMKTKEEAQLVLDYYRTGKWGPPIPANQYSSATIPVNDTELEEYIIQIEFDSSSHAIAAIGLISAGTGQVPFYRELVPRGDSLWNFPSKEQEGEMLKELSDQIHIIKNKSEKVHFYVWSKRELNYFRELLDRYSGILHEIADLASIFIAPTHFHPPHYMQSQFASRSNLVASPVTVLYDEIKRAFCLPSLYTHSLFIIGSSFGISEAKFLAKDYRKYVHYFTDGILAEGIHHFWAENKSTVAKQRGIIHELVQHKLNVLRIILLKIREEHQSKLTREAFQSSALQYSYNYPGGIAKEAHPWLLQTSLNFSSDASSTLAKWQLPPEERVAQGISAHLTFLSLEEWEKIFFENEAKWKARKFKPYYPDGTFVFKVHHFSTDFDVKEGNQASLSLAPRGRTLELLKIVPSGLKKFHANTHLSNGAEYHYDLSSCREILLYRDGYAVIQLWENNSKSRKKGYNPGQWDARKRDFWKSKGMDNVYTLEKFPFDILTQRLEECLPMLFPTEESIKEVHKKVIDNLKTLVDLLGKNKGKRELKDACYHLLDDLPPQTEGTVEDADRFKETIDEFVEESQNIAQNLTADEKKKVYEIEQAVKRIHMYAFFEVVTPVGTNEGMSKLYTYTAQRLLNPLRKLHPDENLKGQEFDNAVESIQEITSSQRKAIRHFLSQSVSLLWGPPGSGKSYTLRKFMEVWHLLFPNKKVLITAASHAAIDELVSGLSPEIEKKTKRFRSAYDLESGDYEEFQFFAATPQQVWRAYYDRNTVWNLSEHSFDLVVIDESGQLPPAQAVLTLSSIKEETRVVLAGDDLQIPPIHQYVHPEGLENYLSSCFSYYKNIHDYKPIMLEESFRSHPDIVTFLARNVYPGFRAGKTKEETTISFVHHSSRFFQEYTASAITIITEQDRNSDRINEGQIRETLQIIKAALEARLKNNNGQAYELTAFFQQGVAIIAPYRVQYFAIQRKLIQMVKEWCSTSGVDYTLEVEEAIRGAVDTVHSFQGKERDLIIVTLPTGIKNLINDAHFLKPNLLNVAFSRAKKKLIVLCTENALNWSNSTNEEYPTLFENPYLLRALGDYCKNKISVSKNRTIYHC